MLSAAGQAIMAAGDVDSLGQASLYFSLSDDVATYAKRAQLVCLRTDAWLSSSVAQESSAWRPH